MSKLLAPLSAIVLALGFSTPAAAAQAASQEELAGKLLGLTDSCVAAALSYQVVSGCEEQDYLVSFVTEDSQFHAE
jgi:4-hydroxybenzoate polyprenyltransferase